MSKNKFFVLVFNTDIKSPIDTTIYPDQLLSKEDALKRIMGK